MTARSGICHPQAQIVNEVTTARIGTRFLFISVLLWRRFSHNAPCRALRSRTRYFNSAIPLRSSDGQTNHPVPLPLPSSSAW